MAGRGDQLGDFRVLRGRAERVVAGRSVILTGPRGVGKTVLLNEMAAKAARDGWLLAKLELDVALAPNAGSGTWLPTPSTGRCEKSQAAGGSPVRPPSAPSPRLRASR